MITVIPGIIDANGEAKLAFRADRSYDVYALEGSFPLGGSGEIYLGCSNSLEPLPQDLLNFPAYFEQFHRQNRG
ncbi:unnamed protein product [marine sediment metagenome]|uniref:Uncharacterized protein n=1 Tax=marine sediment metagenome TaxID=412755 RepID=X1N661_9ZZZZ